MNLNLYLKESRTTKSIDEKSERAKRFLPYLEHNKPKHVNFKVKPLLKIPKTHHETHVRRFDQENGITLLNIRFASADKAKESESDDRTFINNSHRKLATEPNSQQNQNDGLLPYLKSKRYQSPQQYLKNVGYDSDLRVATQIYSDKIQEKKVKYINRMDALKRDLQNCTQNRRQTRMQKSRIQVKILGEQIRRKRQRQFMAQQQKKGQRMLQSLLQIQI